MISIKEQIILDSEHAKLKSKCEHCGHTQFTPAFVDKTICRWCHNAIYNQHFECGKKAKFKDLFMKAKKELKK